MKKKKADPDKFEFSYSSQRWLWQTVWNLGGLQVGTLKIRIALSFTWKRNCSTSRNTILYGGSVVQYSSHQKLRVVIRTIL